MSASGGRQGGSGRVSRRAIAGLIGLWSTLAVLAFAAVCGPGSLTTPAEALDVGVFIGIAWFVGVLVLILFAALGVDDEARPP